MSTSSKNEFAPVQWLSTVGLSQLRFPTSWNGVGKRSCKRSGCGEKARTTQCRECHSRWKPSRWRPRKTFTGTQDDQSSGQCRWHQGTTFFCRHAFVLLVERTKFILGIYEFRAEGGVGYGREEMDVLVENDMWKFVDCPKNVNVIDNRWILWTKLNVGLTKRLRSGLVAKGHVQTAGIDYDETLRPVDHYA